MNNEYKDILKQYTIKDGICAIIFFVLYIYLSFFQGYLYTTMIPTNLLVAMQIIFPIFTFLLCAFFVLFAKRGIGTIGMTTQNMGKSLCMGVIGTLLILCFQFVTNLIQSGSSFSIELTTGITIWIFIAGAISEEFIFRGYIQTRICGLLKTPVLASCMTALLFLLIHYPVKWVVSGTISFSSEYLSQLHIVYLLLLHFSCAYVYKKTNCLWGAVLLHFLYNLVSSMIVYQ